MTASRGEKAAAGVIGGITAAVIGGVWPLLFIILGAYADLPAPLPTILSIVGWVLVLPVIAVSTLVGVGVASAHKRGEW